MTARIRPSVPQLSRNPQMFGLFTPRCPIGPRERVLVERGLARIVEIVGLEWVRRTSVLTPADLQDVLNVEPIAAADIAARLAPQFPFPVDGIVWQEDADIAGQLGVEYLAGDPPTGVVPHQPDQTPELRTAHVARCLCEHALATRREFAVIDGPSQAAVDLLCVVTGVGLFPANTTFSSQYRLNGLMESWQHWQQPFIPSRLFGYAFAVRCFLCEEANAPWSAQLRLDAREPFDLGLRFLRKRRPVVWDASRDTLRSFLSAPSVEDVVRKLRHREAAVQINALFDVTEYGLGEPAIQREIGHLVHDHIDEVREEAIRAIVLLNAESTELGDALIFLCEDSQPRVRSLAARALGEIRHPPADAVQTLRMLTGDAEPIVSAAAAESFLSFPQALEEDGPRLFRVLRQQLARCNYQSVDRFIHRLNNCVTDAARVIEQEFAGSDEETWRQLLLQSLAGASGADAGS